MGDCGRSGCSWGRCVVGGGGWGPSARMPVVPTKGVPETGTFARLEFSMGGAVLLDATETVIIDVSFPEVYDVIASISLTVVEFREISLSTSPYPSVSTYPDDITTLHALSCSGVYERLEAFATLHGCKHTGERAGSAPLTRTGVSNWTTRHRRDRG